MYGQKRLTSTTTILGKYKPEFKAKFWAGKKAKERKVSKKTIEKEWEYKRNYGLTKGNIIHRYIENYFNSRIYDYPFEEVKEILGDKNVLYQPVQVLKSHFHKFWKERQDYLIPVKSEWIIGDTELMVGGTIDQLFYNLQTEMYEIHDWKNNKQFRTEATFENWMKPPLHHIDASNELEAYSLQLSIYRTILERNTDLEIGGCYLNWLFEENDSYKSFLAHDLRKEANRVLIQHAGLQFNN